MMAGAVVIHHHLCDDASGGGFVIDTYLCAQRKPRRLQIHGHQHDSQAYSQRCRRSKIQSEHELTF